MLDRSRRFIPRPGTARALATGLLALCAASAPAAGQDDGLGQAARALLVERCFACHGPDRAAREAELRLDTRDGLLADRGGYAAVVPGQRDASELWLRISSELDPMPPAELGAGLDQDDRALLAAWIDAGAPWPRHWAYAPLARAPAPRVADEAWPANDLDRFVLARLDAHGLAPAPEADRRTLIRRASLDLIGLPPTPDEVRAFLADESPGAWPRVVDRLLASPHYGERQARHWLDLARYADSHGFTIDGARSIWPWRDQVVAALNADQPFDRFTLEQLAGDLLPEPTNEQLVATGFQRNTQINQEGGAKDEENRVNAVLDRVNTVGEVWLGTTLGCAQCHDHKYDAIEQRDYFRLYAFFDQTVDGGVAAGPSTYVTPDEPSRELLARHLATGTRLARDLARAEERAAAGWSTWHPQHASGSNGPQLRLGDDGSIESIGQNPVTSVYDLVGPAPAGAVSALRLEALPSIHLGAGGPGRSSSGNFVLTGVRVSVRTSADEGGWRELPLAAARADFEQDTRQGGGGLWPVAGALDPASPAGWGVAPEFGQPHVAHFELAEALPGDATSLRIELFQEHGGHHVLGRLRVRLGPRGAGQPVAAVVDANWTAAWSAWADHARQALPLARSLVMRERETPRVTRLFGRGSFLDPREVVTPGFPAALDFERADAGAPPRNRLDLARWLVHPGNALVQRVTVNRWWQQLFGRGLVETENDFGVRGARPSHPELLDWLAAQLVEGGWSRKALLRTIVSSRTYRQASRPRPELAELDPRNRLLARQSRRRVEAEVLRDAALAASGLLDPTLGGPPVQPPQPDGVFDFTQSAKVWTPSEGGARFRRSLYTRLWRSSAYPFFTTFDAPVANVTCTRRGRSNTPLQALTLANDPMLIELADGLGRRLLGDEGSDEARLARAFELCLARPPRPEERALLLDHLARVRRPGDDPDGARAWRAVARVLFNLDEFLTRE